MTLQQMEYVVAVDKYRHFVKAAESCNVSQSTLSMMIKKLEDELDVMIFDRDARPVRPTIAGEIVIEQIKVILFNTKQLRELTLSERELNSGICHDSCGRYYLVGKILKKFFGILDADYLAGVVNADEERSAMSVGE